MTLVCTYSMEASLINFGKFVLINTNVLKLLDNKKMLIPIFECQSTGLGELLFSISVTKKVKRILQILTCTYNYHLLFSRLRKTERVFHNMKQNKKYQNSGTQIFLSCLFFITNVSKKFFLMICLMLVCPIYHFFLNLVVHGQDG